MFSHTKSLLIFPHRMWVLHSCSGQPILLIGAVVCDGESLALEVRAVGGAARLSIVIPPWHPCL